MSMWMRSTFLKRTELGGRGLWLITLIKSFDDCCSQELACTWAVMGWPIDILTMCSNQLYNFEVCSDFHIREFVCEKFAISLEFFCLRRELQFHNWNSHYDPSTDANSPNSLVINVEPYTKKNSTSFKKSRSPISRYMGVIRFVSPCSPTFYQRGKQNNETYVASTNWRWGHQLKSRSSLIYLSWVS